MLTIFFFWWCCSLLPCQCPYWPLTFYLINDIFVNIPFYLIMISLLISPSCWIINSIYLKIYRDFISINLNYFIFLSFYWNYISYILIDITLLATKLLVVFEYFHTITTYFLLFFWLLEIYLSQMLQLLIFLS